MCGISRSRQNRVRPRLGERVATLVEKGSQLDGLFAFGADLERQSPATGDRILDDMLIEIYHTTSVMIDETRMIAAEEGCLCKFDLEHLKNETKEGNFDPGRISSKIKEQLLKKMDEVFDAIKI